MTTATQPKLENLGSLITYKDGDGQDVCLGYLFDFSGHGHFSPDGKVEITAEDAKAHNAALDAAELEGLDKNCEIGQRGTFYLIKGNVQTWIGTLVAAARVNGTSVTFSRKGKTYRGRTQKDADCFNFKRIA
jgi:hypothetical protein